ncbi:MAG: signal peptidase I, partial [Mailhella sp.]|nr:signal peptidase I [Mailhella sp.]
MSELLEKKAKSAFRDYVEALIFALALAFVIRAFVVQSFTIPSGSMLQTIQIGDYLLVNKFIYGVKIPFTHTYLFRGADPQNGDIIVFEYPRDPDTDYIKRVVGVPGDVLEMKNKKFYRNGQL